ncbi:hypothetical protein BLA29_008776 [Euroglyphus maynei]|uniref:Uncharacterized protein n=1 Tax=Euroglyphus maynei TaxID=6958 RepID=A0A1Y3BIN6_EURMA|nr:hypothetical protein BLA29_008776 [Euroglyphus maynei]
MDFFNHHHHDAIGKNSKLISDNKINNFVLLERKFFRLTSQFIQYSYENRIFNNQYIMNTDLELIFAIQQIYRIKPNLLIWLMMSSFI